MPASHRRRRRAPQVVVPVLAGLCLLGAVSAGVWSVLQPSPAPARAEGRPTLTPAEAEARSLLGTWDAARADAWASGDAPALAALYTPGSAAGRADVDHLRAWGARGLRVEGLRVKVGALQVRESSPSRRVIVVLDRVVGARAAGADGAVRALPADAPSCRALELRRVGGAWLMASVAEASDCG